MSRFEVTASELHAAAGSLRAARGELGGGLGAGGGMGTGALEGALAALAGRIEMVAEAYDQALAATAGNADASAESYVATDHGAMPR